MGKRRSDSELGEDIVQLLGYMNFSSGNMEPPILAAMNRIYADALPSQNPYQGMPSYLQAQQWLEDWLTKLGQTKPAFNDSSQAASVLKLSWQLLPAYMDFHRDLLFHQEAEGLFNGFFMGKAIEAVVVQGPPWDETDRIVHGAIDRLNDFVGYRPVAVLEGRRAPAAAACACAPAGARGWTCWKRNRTRFWGGVCSCRKRSAINDAGHAFSVAAGDAGQTQVDAGAPGHQGAPQPAPQAGAGVGTDFG